MFLGILVLSLIIIALLLQSLMKIPTPITILFCTIILKYLHITYPLTSDTFDTLVILTIPLLITSDAIRLSFNELKEHWLSLFTVAVLAVIISVGLGILVDYMILPEYHIGIAGVIMIMCMLTATDPVTVSSIFSTAKVPHKLKLLTEGESLFNDATALILFSIAIMMLKDKDINAIHIFSQSSLMLGVALFIGCAVGFITTLLLRLTEDVMIETTIILLCAYASFGIAEFYHVSGILAVIVSVLIVNRQIDIANKSQKILKVMKKQIHTLHNQQQMNHIFEYFSIIFSSLLFIAIAIVTDITQLFTFWKEILLMFVISTIIRAVTMAKFAFMSNNVSRMHNVSIHWWGVLTMAGSKGALSLLMAHMIPDTYPHKILFENIIIGNILLSTITYTIGLYLILYLFRNRFNQEIVYEYI